MERDGRSSDGSPECIRTGTTKIELSWDEEKDKQFKVVPRIPGSEDKLFVHICVNIITFNSLLLSQSKLIVFITF